MSGMPRVSVGCELVRAISHSGRARVLGRAARLPSAALSIFDSLLSQARSGEEAAPKGSLIRSGQVAAKGIYII